MNIEVSLENLKNALIKQNILTVRTYKNKLTDQLQLHNIDEILDKGYYNLVNEELHKKTDILFDSFLSSIRHLYSSEIPSVIDINEILNQAYNNNNFNCNYILETTSPSLAKSFRIDQTLPIYEDFKNTIKRNLGYIEDKFNKDKLNTIKQICNLFKSNPDLENIITQLNIKYEKRNQMKLKELENVYVIIKTRLDEYSQNKNQPNIDNSYSISFKKGLKIYNIHYSTIIAEILYYKQIVSSTHKIHSLDKEFRDYLISITKEMLKAASGDNDQQIKDEILEEIEGLLTRFESSSKINTSNTINEYYQPIENDNQN